ncbi:hypothetical protein ACBR40_35280 [Nonomuraea sp. AD125B]|uniref:hypothetical protein n=1 Tax=Nonomuraea sp. AD125B TaxID=3242897 RepID=UPI003529BA7B
MTAIEPGELRGPRSVQVGAIDINMPPRITSDQVNGLNLLRPSRTGVILLLAVIAVLLLGIVATKDHAMTALISQRQTR